MGIFPTSVEESLRSEHNFYITSSIFLKSTERKKRNAKMTFVYSLMHSINRKLIFFKNECHTRCRYIFTSFGHQSCASLWRKSVIKMSYQTGKSSKDAVTCFSLCVFVVYEESDYLMNISWILEVASFLSFQSFERKHFKKYRKSWIQLGISQNSMSLCLNK